MRCADLGYGRQIWLPMQRLNEMNGKKEEGRSSMNGSFDRAFFLGVRGDTERFGMSWIRLPAASAGEPGGKDELPGCIGVLGESTSALDFGSCRPEELPWVQIWYKK